MGIRCADHVTLLYPQNLALTSPTGGDRSVGIVRSRTKATEVVKFEVVTAVLMKIFLSYDIRRRVDWFTVYQATRRHPSKLEFSVSLKLILENEV